MDKFIKLIEESATIEELLNVVNKREKRRFVDYLKYYIPFAICAILLYAAVVLFIIYGIKKYIPAFISTFTVIYILFVWGTFDKYFALQIFRHIRSKELKHFKE